MTRLGLMLLATLVYAATLGSVSPVDLLVGAVLGALVVAGCGRWRPPRLPPRHERAAAWPKLAFNTVREIASGSASMLRLLVGRESSTPAGVVELPTEGLSDRGAVITAWIVSVSPGSVVLRIDEERSAISVHVIDVEDARALGRQIPRLLPEALKPQVPG